MTAMALVAVPSVDARLVGEEVIIDVKVRLHRSPGQDLPHDGLLIIGQCVGGPAKVPISRVASIVACLTRASTGRRRQYASTGGQLSLDVVLTAGKAVRFTAYLRPVQSTGNDSTLDVVLPGDCRKAAIAAEAIRAGVHVLSGELHLQWVTTLAGSYANAIRHGFYSTEDPARAARTLISNLTYGGAVRPLLARVKVAW